MPATCRLPATIRSRTALAPIGVLTIALAAPAAARAQFSWSSQQLTPVVDRWMYPFASSAGTRPTAAVFSPLNDTTGIDDRFDDYDAQVLIVLNTSTLVESGLPAGMYRVAAAAVTLRVSSDQTFAYDPTRDPLGSFYLPTDPGFVPDPDAGRPVELFGAAYRNGFNIFTYGETSAFKPGGQFTGPWLGVRHCYNAIFDDLGNPTDASRPVTNRTDYPPMAVGLTSAASPGDLVPLNSDFVFTLDLAQPRTREYVQRALSTGRIALLVASLHKASEDGRDGQYPLFYLREADPIIFDGAAPPRLDLTAGLCKADFNADGALNDDDLGEFITAYFEIAPGPGGYAPAATATPAGCPDAEPPYATLGFRGDFTRDCSLNDDDLGAFITAYFLGCD